MIPISGLALVLSVLPSPGPQLPVPARPVALRVEHLANPLGIDVATPRFSWQMADARRGARQTGYRILVASNPARLTAARADVWNSDVVTSNQSLDIEYAGSTLTARHRYYWTVCIRDQNNRMAPCAAPAWFETGKLGEPWQRQLDRRVDGPARHHRTRPRRRRCRRPPMAGRHSCAADSCCELHRCVPASTSRHWAGIVSP